MAKKKRPAPQPARGRAASGGSGRQAQRGQRWLLFGVLGIVLVVVVVSIIGATVGNDDDQASDTATTADTSSAACMSDTRMDHYSSEDKVPVVHTDSPGYEGPLAPRDNPTYTVNPPSGGDHLSMAVSPGVYEGDRVPPDGNLVHSLEHGYVIIWFRPDISDADKQALRVVFDKYRRDTLLVERTDMERPVAATAWGRRTLCDGVDQGKLSSFIEDFRNKAPEKIPH
jgi:hypothetical protein